MDPVLVLEALGDMANEFGLPGLLGTVVGTLLGWRLNERSRRSSVLHQRRVEVMDGLMERLVTLQRLLDGAAGLQTLDDPAGLKPLHEATDAGDAAWRFYAARRYYLSQETCHKIEPVMKEMKAAWAALSTAAVGRAEGRAGPSHDALFKSGVTKVRERLPAAMNEVEAEFRRLVGGGGDS